MFSPQRAGSGLPASAFIRRLSGNPADPFSEDPDDNSSNSGSGRAHSQDSSGGDGGHNGGHGMTEGSASDLDEAVKSSTQSTDFRRGTRFKKLGRMLAGKSVSDFRLDRQVLDSNL